ncbi:PREDICTED: myb family transcription factor EFM-like isoform X2 [Lupinus angustifolius]|uniref:myb family transcription factor EFM-like isoform X2 n=1 Tax=Lupinus angustifolius TaxID=3871 RepID=UPI00092E2B26|nr:PREDICTED: myb family transcription factor EFM-like isoform X2 [Lupinus angustifolius]
MGSVPAELSLDLRPNFVSKTITDFLSTLPSSQNNKLSLLNDFIARLEHEFRKIDAFKRELPLSMLILNDAISVLKEESEKCMSYKSQPVLEVFIPLKKECDEEYEVNNNKDKECKDKKNWMSSVQLWNTTTTTNNVYDQKQHHHKLVIKKIEDERKSVAENHFQPSSSRNEGGRGFLPLSTCTSIPMTTVALPPTKEEIEEGAVNTFSLLTPPLAVKNSRKGCSSSVSGTNSNRELSSSPPTALPSLCTGLLQQQQASRKQRRCWSPELHRRFVNALQNLGGSQVATPKQIREHMQVDGLTNDEVKSHLQFELKLDVQQGRVQGRASMGAGPSRNIDFIHVEHLLQILISLL